MKLLRCDEQNPHRLENQRILHLGLISRGDEQPGGREATALLMYGGLVCEWAAKQP